MLRMTLLLVCLVAVNTGQAQVFAKRYAQAEPAGLELTDGSVRAVALVDNKAQIDIQGLTARVNVEQRYHYAGDEARDARYVFPLPENAAIKQLQIRIGDRVIDGVVKEKAQARAVYEQARQEGRRAALLEQQRPNLFSVDIARLQPGDVLTVALVYVHSVDYRKGEFSLRYPQYYVQRYQPMLSASPEIPASNAGVLRHRVSGSIDLGLPLAELDARYHELRLQRKGANYVFEMGQATSNAADDFVLRWQVDTGSDIRLAAFSEIRNDARYLHLLLLPALQESIAKQNREQTFIIDVSGSMAGPPIRQAKQSLLRALAQLESGDSFNIVAYNNRAWSLFDEPQRAADFNLTLARSFVEGLEADGGTEMLPALALALQQPAVTNADVLPQVLFMTDGAVSNESGLLNYIDQHLGERRLFTIGIGSAPNSYFMRKAAQTGRGSYEYVANSEELPLYMDRLLARIRQAALSDISVEWPQGISPEYYPQRLPDLYPGESLLMSVRVDGSEAMPGQIRLNARHQGRVWHASAEIPDQTGAVPPGALATVWARAKIETLTDALNALGGASDAVEKQALLQQQILDTALEYQLASQFTSFVAVDSQRVQENKTRKQAAHYLAQTGNGATQSLLWGSVLLLMFIVIYRCIQREA